MDTLQVSICSREKLEQLLQRKSIDNTAIISFYDPPSARTPQDYRPVDFTSYNSPVFQVGVHDIDLEILKDYGLAYDTFSPRPIGLAEFIYLAVNRSLPIICQCEYGQSRSPACAAAIQEHFCQNGIRIFADYRYYPNQLIFNKTLDALNQLKAQDTGNFPKNKS